MPPTVQDLIAETKSSIREITVAELHEALQGGHPPVVVDIREPDEVANGVIPGALVVPRGFLELKIESLVPDKEAPVAIYCAGGTRSALATRAVAELGFQDVVSLEGGLGAWSRAGHGLEHRKQLNTEQRARYARQMILPQLGEAGQ